MRTSFTPRARHSASRVYSLAMPSSALMTDCATAALAQVSRSVCLLMNASCIPSIGQGKEYPGNHFQRLELSRRQTRARGLMERSTSSRRWVLQLNQQRGFFTMGQLDSGAIRNIERMSDVGAMRYASQNSGRDDYEIADEIGISHGYMSKVLKGTASLSGRRLVKFMRATKCIAPLQWLGDQMGCDVIERHSHARDLAAALAKVQELQGHAS